MKKIANIGITGGIGSGKSFVCHLLKQKGIRVFEADARAKEILNSNTEIQAKVIAMLGRESYTKEGKADRAKIAGLVFSNPDLLKSLNAIVHPATLEEFENWKKQAPKDYPWAYQIKEAAILFESGTDKGLDAIVTVSAPEELRIQRVITRDQVSRDQVLERLRKQLSEEERIRRSDYVILNDGAADVERQIQDLHQTLEKRFGN